MRSIKLGPLLASALFLGALVAEQARANALAPKMREAFDRHLGAFAASPEVIAALRAHNDEHAGISQSEIERLDAAWRAALPSGGGELYREIRARPCSQSAAAAQEAADGAVLELFVAGLSGLNVCQTALTSDLYQGDEAKWREPMAAGPGGELIENLEWDIELGVFLSKINRTIVDPETGEAIGVISAGLNPPLL